MDAIQPQDATDILAEKIETVRDETGPLNGHRGFIVLCASTGCRCGDGRFADVEMDGDMLNLLVIDNLDQAPPQAQKVEGVTLREIDLSLKRVPVTGTERGRWRGPLTQRNDRQDQPMGSPLRTAAPGTIRVLFDDVSINGVRLGLR